MNNKSNNVGIVIGGIIGIISVVGIILLSGSNLTINYSLTDTLTDTDLQTNIFENKSIYKKILKIKVEPEYLGKISQLLIKESGLDKDPYDRKPGLETIKIFSKIAKYHGIKLSYLNKELDSKTFDFLYKQLVKFQIITYTNNQIIN